MSYFGNMPAIGWKGIGSALAGAGISYFLLGRERMVDIFGVDVPHWAADGLIIAAGSITGDMTTDYILPVINGASGLNGSIAMCLNDMAPSIITGAEFSAIKKFIVSEQANNAALGYINKWDFALGFSAKMLGDKIGNCLSMSAKM